jgi:hypothetical protein
LLARLREGGVRSQDVGLENWHITRPDGRQERVMVVTSDRENARGAKEARFFGVDAEGLPVPRPLDQKLAFNPAPNFVKTLIGQGQVTFHQRQETLTFNDGTTATADWQNEGLKDLQVFLKSRTFSCRGRDCQCL